MTTNFVFCTIHVTRRIIRKIKLRERIHSHVEIQTTLVAVMETAVMVTVVMVTAVTVPQIMVVLMLPIPRTLTLRPSVP